MNEPECIAKTGAILGEGPVWHDQVLHWLDIESRLWYRYRDGTAGKVREFPFRVTAVAPRQSGGFVLAGERGIQLLSSADGEPAPLVDPDARDRTVRFNDGKCDSSGRFWAGTMGFQAEPRRGNLYRIDADGSCHRMLAGTTISNGMAWSPDGNTFYFIDSTTRSVCAFPFDAERGALGPSKVVVSIGESDGLPDGMTIDERGFLWIALWGGSRVVCHDPATGAREQEIKLPVSCVTSCVFGGPQLDELYITTARLGLSASQLEAEPLAGSLFRVAVPGVRGLPVQLFAG